MYFVVPKNINTVLDGNLVVPIMWDSRINILDTEDCVLESYSRDEILQVWDKIDIINLNAEKWQTCYRPLSSLLKGKLVIREDKVRYFGSNVLRFDFNKEKLRLTIYAAGNHIAGYIDMLGGTAYRGSCIRLAERFGSRIVVCFRLNFCDTIKRENFFADMRCVFNKDAFESILDIRFIYDNQLRSKRIYDDFKTSGGMIARLKLGGLD